MRSVEQRHQPRMRLTVPVELYRRGKPVAVGFIRNVSRHGIFVRVIGAKVATGTLLKLRTLYQSLGNRSVTAVVVHCSRQGVGLSLLTEDSFKALMGAYEHIRQGDQSERKSMTRAKMTHRPSGIKPWPASGASRSSRAY